MAKIIRQARGRYFVLSFLGALGASVAEVIPRIDNLTIPIFSSILMTLGFYLIH